MPAPQRPHAQLPALAHQRAHEPRPASAPSGAHDSPRLTLLDARAAPAPLDARTAPCSPESPGAHEGPPPAQRLRLRPRSLAIAGALVAGLVIAGWAIWKTTHIDGDLQPTHHATAAPPPSDLEPAPRRAPRSLRAAPPRAAADDAGQGALDATPSIARLEVVGPVPDATVRQAVEGTLDALRGCYRAAARARGITPPAELRLAFELDEHRDATGIHATTNAPLDALARCATVAVGELHASAPAGGRASVVATIAFRPH